jgi:ribosomal protein S18 acetylase RimI-like enzyme
MGRECWGIKMSIIFANVTPAMLDDCAKVIRESFITVANDFNLTRENAPTNPAFIEGDTLNKMYEKNISMFTVYKSDVQIGFVAIEKADDTLYYMEKLAILPEYRHKGYGIKVMDFVMRFVKSRGGKRVSIGIINENTVLKNWYISYGFRETGTKTYPHLPFTVCFMEKEL